MLRLLRLGKLAKLLPQSFPVIFQGVVQLRFKSIQVFFEFGPGMLAIMIDGLLKAGEFVFKSFTDGFQFFFVQFGEATQLPGKSLYKCIELMPDFSPQISGSICCLLPVDHKFFFQVFFGIPDDAGCISNTRFYFCQIFHTVSYTHLDVYKRQV